jgi:hypothetical protein
MKQSGLSNTRCAYDRSPLPLKKSEIQSLENLDTFGSISIGLEKLFDLN